jgi:DNA (cytosine-5)-methyltransferase 1
MTGLRVGSLCSGFGGLEMAVRAAFGGETVFHADPDPGASKILAHHWPKIPNLGDITAVDWRQVLDLYGPVDLATMGFPCTDVSLAGLGAGIAPGTRSGLWTHCATTIEALNPRFVVIENVRGLLSAPAHSDLEPCSWCVGDGRDEPVLRALGAVLGDLADLGFDAEWIGLPASDSAIGACHERWREFILAWRADADPNDLGRHRRAGDDAEAGGRDELADRGDAAAGSGSLTFLPTQAARDWKSGARNTSKTLDAQWISTDGVDYRPTIRRWEAATGQLAPCPTEPGAKGNRRLNPAFSEWMIGAPAGHITAVPDLSRKDQLRAIGNGVVWQQGAHALRVLHARASHSLAVAA